MHPLPMTLHPSQKKMALLTIGTGVFVIGGIAIYPSLPFVGAIAILLFGLGFIVGLIGLLPNSAYLELTTKGFTFVSFFRRHFVAWESVASFLPIKLGLNSLAGYNYAPQYAGFRSLTNPNIALAGAEAALPDSYGMSVEALCKLMNEIKQQIESSKAAPDPH